MLTPVVTVSPDGSRIVYVANRRLYVRSLSESTPREIQGSEDPEGVTTPSFSPDGQSVFFARQIRGSNYEIFRMGLDGSNVTQLTSNGAQNYAPTLSPDGTRVAVWCIDQTDDIWIWDLQRRAMTKLTDGPTEDLLPVWSPDGRRVFFSSDRTGNFDLYAINDDGSGLVDLTNSPPSGTMSSHCPRKLTWVQRALGRDR